MMLRHPRFDRPFIFYTDASVIGLGAVLCQKDDEGKEWAIHMASRTLQSAEKNNFTTELELLAIIWALNKFRSYILGSKTIIKTDHRALSFLSRCKA